MQGGGDVLVDPSSAQLVARCVPSRDVTLKFYDGLYHEVFNEIERRSVLDDVLRWLDEHADPRSQ
jgi:alpha-beta hydrolase superfamily lysophospholipase